MTRMERRRIRRRRARIRAALIILMITFAVVFVSCVSTRGAEEASNTQETAFTPAPIREAEEINFVEDKSEAMLLKATRAVYVKPTMIDAPAENEIEIEYEEDEHESEKIEEALVEKGYLSPEIPMDFDTQCMLRCYCEQYEIPYSIALGVVEAESSFRPDVSNGSCFGYMQINKINLEWLREEIGIDSLEDPIQNLHSGVYILHDLFEKYGDWHKTLVCYNYGEAGAKEHVFSYGYTSTSYSRTVMSYAEKWAGVIVDDYQG